MACMAAQVGAMEVAAETLDGDMQLPIKIPYDLMLTKWSSILNPVIANPLNDVSFLKNIALATGNNTVPHLLARMQEGWFITDINAAATIYRYKPLNSQFLYLNASAPVTVNIGVF